ncbi:MAG: hypothetical protein N3A71_01515 [Candidatus Dojkabacteria bacterium]|nr:hypothetical protein [Candidatus Dojkabacteria bacterium]
MRGKLLILVYSVLVVLSLIIQLQYEVIKAESNTHEESNNSQNNTENKNNDNRITISPAKIYKRLKKESGFNEKIDISTNLEINDIAIEIFKKESFHTNNYVEINLPGDLIKITTSADKKTIDIFVDTNKLNTPLNIYKLTILVNTKSENTNLKTKFEIPIIINITDLSLEDNQKIYPKFKLHQINKINFNNKIDYRLEIINPHEYIFLLGGEVIINDNQDKILIKSSIRESPELDFYPRQYIDFKKSFDIFKNTDLIQSFTPKQIKVHTFINVDDDILELEKIEILVIPESFVYLLVITIISFISIVLFIKKSRQNTKNKN